MEQTALRTHYCGSLSAENVGTTVRLGGWVHRRRDLGGIVFLDLRDREGLVQLSCDPDWTPQAVLDRAASVGVESVVLVDGVVELRRDPGRDRTMRSREVEVRVNNLEIVGSAATPAIPVALREGEAHASEEMRLLHRILDLRRPELQKNLMLRHRLLQRARSTLCGLGFMEIETPILTKPTPEGARDYLVPSSVHPGEFYALPQSPQIYKQLLMMAGCDRYFQIARCFRDEDLRSDRQPEFTQIDLEASFVNAEDVMAVIEAVLSELWAEGGHKIESPFVRLTHGQAMEQYGVDKPDLRYGLVIADYSNLIGDDAAPFVADAISGGARLRGIIAPGLSGMSRKELDGLTEVAKDAGAGGLVWAKYTEAGWAGQGVKAIGEMAAKKLPGQLQDLFVAVIGPDAVTSPALHAVRSALTARPECEKQSDHSFAWVIDFPLFEQDAVTGQWIFTHHPFTAPHPEDIGYLKTDPSRCRATHYDAVYNGNELGSGSIRITDPELQSMVFEFLGLSAHEQRGRFGFLLDALASGAPPHGGFALGFDRIAMLLSSASSLRDVIAFPKTTQARALFEGAPVPLPNKELEALHIRTTVEHA